MRYTFFSHYTDGTLALAKPTLCTDDKELQTKFKKFKQETVEEGIGDQASYLSQEDMIDIHSLLEDEVLDTGA